MFKIKKVGMVVSLFLLFFLFGYHCPFQSLTGFPCPGCNMTTSLYYLLKGNVSASLYYHGLLIPTMFIFILCICFHKRKHIYMSLLLVWSVCMILYYMYRMYVYFPNAPMYYDVHNVFYFIYDIMRNAV